MPSSRRRDGDTIASTAWNLHAIAQTRLRRHHRVDGVGRLKLDVRTVRDVAGDLELGSAGREGAGQAHDQHLLAGAGLAHVEEDGRVELEAVLRA